MFEFFTSNIWPIFLIILFFGGSIFVHELGHFLAARRRGLVVERFSIGFGPKIVSWKRNGVEYRLSWLPLGGYVALPQLADMGAIEGATERDPEKLPPLTYSDKMIVSVMGAVFNVIFAFLLAFIIWFTGKPTSEDALSTSVGYVVPTFTLPDGEIVPSP
ncbi:MAG TPA: site-2 protease family protein, partial [Opitutales bacterium]|nr:site-2 protease family protein [Opitutales bacterium]